MASFRVIVGRRTYGEDGTTVVADSTNEAVGAEGRYRWR